MERNEMYYDHLREHFIKAMNYNVSGALFFRPNSRFTYVKHPFVFTSEVKKGMYIIREWRLDEALYYSKRMRYAGATKAMCTSQESPVVVSYHSFDAMIEDLWDADCDIELNFR